MNLFDVYPLFDIAIDHGKGCHVWDEQGQEYLDLYGGHAVISIGHCHPHYVEAMTQQLNKLGFYSNSVQNPLQKELAKRLGKASGYEDYQLFLINSGAEANENALKLASFYNGRTRVLSMEKAFHGRTSLAVEVTNNPKIIAPINSNGHVTYLPINDIQPWKEEIERGDVCAVIIECIQGVGGIRMVTKEFMFFAHQHLDVQPDIITVAKGICNGFPMGGVLISPKFTPVYGQLGTTFGGNHLGCAGAIAVLDVMEREHLVENAAKVGKYLIDTLKAEQAAGNLPHVVDVRGEGLMIGIELDIPYKVPRTRLIKEEHCFTGCAGTNVIRLLPPLCLSMDEAKLFIEKFKRVL